MKNRYLPFGYKIADGKIVADSEQVEAVRRIFDAYTAGQTFQQIADALSAQGIPYRSDASRWNKNMVSRILANADYCGTAEYPQIITAGQFEAAEQIRKSKTVTYSATLKPFRKDMHCGCCGARLYWHPKSNQWFCRECGMWSKPTQAEETFNSIVEKLRWLQQNPELIHPPAGKANVQSMEIVLLDREIEQALLDEEPDADALITKILHRAELEYEFCSAGDADPATMQIQKACAEYTDYANERYHVQKIVEQHYWLFGEQYNLVTADQRMQKALANYLNILYGSDAPDATLNPDQEEMRRMDIFLCGARKTEDSVGDEIQENLVIELKAPKVVLTKKVLRQIEDYMDFVRKQPQFNTQLCRWRFIAVCNNVDDDVRARYATNQTKGKKGLVFSVENYELYALTWADVFKSFELRHSFLLKKLKIDQEAIEKDISQQLGNSTGREAVNNLTALALPVSMISG